MKRVIYPGLASHPAHFRAAKLFGGSFGGMLSFELKGDVESADALLDALKLPLPAVRYSGFSIQDCKCT